MLSIEKLSMQFFSVSPCASVPCYNNASCSTAGFSFTCSCADGYHGERCENKGN